MLQSISLQNSMLERYHVLFVPSVRPLRWCTTSRQIWPNTIHLLPLVTEMEWYTLTRQLCSGV